MNMLKRNRQYLSNDYSALIKVQKLSNAQKIFRLPNYLPPPLYTYPENLVPLHRFYDVTARFSLFCNCTYIQREIQGFSGIVTINLYYIFSVYICCHILVITYKRFQRNQFSASLPDFLFFHFHFGKN